MAKPTLPLIGDGIPMDADNAGISTTDGPIISDRKAQELADVSHYSFILNNARVAPAPANGEYAPNTTDNAENEGFGVAIPIVREGRTVVAIFRAQTGTGGQPLRDAAGQPILERDAEGRGIVTAYVDLETDRTIRLANVGDPHGEEHRVIPPSSPFATQSDARIASKN